MKIFVIKKSTLIRASVFVFLILAAVVYTQIIALDTPVMSNNSLEAIKTMGNATKSVAITIDTAFNADYTNEILTVLKEKNVLATFFVTGIWAEKYPNELNAIIQSGHEVANHSYEHKKYTEMTDEEILTDINKTNDKLKSLVFQNIMLVRPPYGAYDDRVLQTIYGNGYVPVKWSVDSQDWKEAGADKIVKNVMGSVKNGSIIMFQTNIADTPQALSEILDELVSEGYGTVTLTQGLKDFTEETY